MSGKGIERREGRRDIAIVMLNAGGCEVESRTRSAGDPRVVEIDERRTLRGHLMRKME
jgi:hypothetical protein